MDQSPIDAPQGQYIAAVLKQGYNITDLDNNPGQTPKAIRVRPRSIEVDASAGNSFIVN